MKLLHNIPSIAIQAVTKMNLAAILSELPKHQQNWVADNAFSANLGEILLLPDQNGMLDGVLFGLGDHQQQTRSRLHFGDLPKKLPALNYHFVESREFDVEQASLAWLLGSYGFTQYNSGSKQIANLISTDKINTNQIENIANSCALAQDLINHPANVMTPKRLAVEAELLSKKFDAQFNCIKGNALLEANFPLIHAVGRASACEPRLIDMIWGNETHPKITLVGKGVCFDTGGLDIKPSASMLLMKKDMGGAANVLGLARMIMAANLPIRLRVLIPAVENTIAGNAFRPSDIYTARNGQTVEINNTDAEGRLVLADALAYANEDKPDLIISMATLTGAARVALGPDLSPYFSTSDELAGRLETAAKSVEDPIWRLPFWDAYEPLIEPGIADLDNAPAGGMAGAITAALFLRRFVDRANYAHFDIYGWTPVAKPARPKGGAAQAIRTIFEMLCQKYGDQ